MVGVAGFEPTTLCPPDKCATRLRYTPTRHYLVARRCQGNPLHVRSLPDEALWKWAEEHARKLPGFRPVEEWRADLEKRLR